MSGALVVIPARMGSTRFPGKVLAMLGGRTVVQRCWEAAAATGLPVLVATESREVADAVARFGGKAVLTSASCRSGTDRVHEAVLQEERLRPVRRVVNLQGDEPFIEPDAILAVARLLEAPGAEVATAVMPLDPALAGEPSVVKASVAPDGACLDFSRSRPAPGGGVFHHVGIYGYTREALERFVRLPPSPREEAERLEQLRALEAGMAIRAARVRHVPIAIDTPEDLRRASEHLRTTALKGDPNG